MVLVAHLVEARLRGEAWMIASVEEVSVAVESGLISWTNAGSNNGLGGTTALKSLVA
jgi:hypothetical protein